MGRMAFVGLAFACQLAGCRPEPRGLAELDVGTPLRSRVIQNVTACVVDAVCFLELRLADTTVQAVYGTGERPAPACPVSPEVSELAFDLAGGEEVEVVLMDCGTEGYVIQELRR